MPEALVPLTGMNGTFEPGPMDTPCENCQHPMCGHWRDPSGTSCGECGCTHWCCKYGGTRR